AARSFEDTTDADLLVIPGGPMTGELGEHPEVRAWLHQMVDRVERLATVCTGSLIASRAGLLNDVRATTHWACIDELAANGATAVQERVVIDGKYYSAAGVSAGIDLALTLVGDIAGSDRAQAIQLLIEYDPAPPFEAGSPKTAPAAVLARVQKRLEKLRATRHNDA
ncbi:MAG: DJ-1/PfpI family protein, partial [Myxococcota bacterium]